MTEQIIHIKSPIGKDDIEVVIAGLEAACGGKRIVINETYDLIVADERQAAALKALFGENGREDLIPKRKPEKIQIARPVSKSSDQKKELGARSYIIEKTGEMISARALINRMKEREITEFTVVTKGDKRFIVTANAQGNLALSREPKA